MLQKLRDELKKYIDSKKAKASSWFFKSGPGEYGEGDIFLGITVPEQHLIAKKFKDLPIKETLELLHSKYHEERLIALFILVSKFKKANTVEKEEIYKLYLENISKYINNWDLVDSSARDIVGAYLINKPKDILFKLAKSENLWERRVSIISTFAFINKKDPEYTLQISEILLNDKHDLIHKAVGWSLREMGKKCGENFLLEFLNKYHTQMPRTMLRYALEKLTPEQKKFYMAK